MSAARTLLLVEDEPDVRMILKWRLMAQSFQVEEAGDGATGLEMAKRLRPAIIVLDIMLPGMDGFEVYRALKQDPLLRGIPVLFLSAAVSSSGFVSKEGLASIAASKYGMKLEGLFDVMAKPYDSDRLESRIRQLVELARLEQRRHRAG